ncbi:type 1 glutamine amidotransferase [Thauera aromatica]|uniref:type 1 glutamine amidotransferase n=1 Tax=Thauera aromatica TaxID=59405 RepID=UPI001FFD47D7|nr:type 1 glutamine amidotransferase [Thauera aromatica]MCK2088944.1 type 1 glutamine amidotransferase [Thauera aromatica]MCK2125687.1 type 1 glutamine amidotransferase [Thauera aromatica]
MKVHILQHVPFEGPGVIEHWLAERGADIGYSRLYASAALPDPAGVDLVVAMGGPMSVNDEAEFPWLAAEKRFLVQAAAQGVAVLGICLGAQLIASAHGARVSRNAEKEIGWFDIEAVAAPPGTADNACFRFPARTTVLHWHGETFELPAGARRLASSAACANQAFQLGERTIGLQFHLEMTAETLRAIVDNCRDELVPARWIEDEAAILDAAPGHFRSTHALMGEVLDYLSRPPRR